MSKYCPAGKIECENFRLLMTDEPYCDICGMVRRYEICPIPSRQLPVKAEDDTLKLLEKCHAIFAEHAAEPAEGGGISTGKLVNIMTELEAVIAACKEPGGKNG